MPRVSSRDNPRLKQAARLVASSRDRRKTGRCVLEGEHVIAVYCERYGAPETLIVVESALERDGIRKLLDRVPAARSLIVTESVWAEFAQFPPGLGAMAVVVAPRPEYRESAEFCLLLDGIQDPGNVGSILRTAAAAGVACIAVGGGVEPDGIAALRPLGAVVVPVVEWPQTVAEAMAAGPGPLERCGERIARLISLTP